MLRNKLLLINSKASFSYFNFHIKIIIFASPLARSTGDMLNT